MTVTVDTRSELEKELDNFLKVCVGEINLSMKDSSQSIRTLTTTFMDMVGDVHKLKVGLEELNVSASEQSKKEELTKLCDSYLDKVQDGTVGFQFYDKLTQRLTHSTKSMKKLLSILSKSGDIEKPENWEKLRDEIRKGFNTEKDRKVFDALMEGETIKKAVNLAMDNQSEEGSVELF